MRMFNARQAIHDAFAIHLTQPNKQDPGHGTKFDSDRAIFNGMKAGLVIKAIMEQSPYLRGAALLLNAPDATATRQEIFALKAKLWGDFRKKRSSITAREEAEVAAIMDDLIAGHRVRVWNHESTMMMPRVLARQLSNRPEVIDRIVANSNAFLDGLIVVENRALAPVWRVIRDQQEKYDNARDQSATTRSA